jgi:hypothetical protein
MLIGRVFTTITLTVLLRSRTSKPESRALFTCRNVYIPYGVISHSGGRPLENKTDERDKQKK